jgi:hypothetical protein
MTINLGRLIAVGFEPAGKWLLSDRGLELVLTDNFAQERDLLYAFAVNGDLVYVGKTVQGLQRRMQGYKSPASTPDNGATTNIRNNRNIIAALRDGRTVEIFAMRSPHAPRHGEFAVNLTAGLEDSLIRTLTPPWNGRRGTSSPVTTTTLAQSTRSAMPLETLQNDKLLNPIEPVPPALGSAAQTIYSADGLFSFARSQQGKPFLTLTRKIPFRVEVAGSFLEITPGSSQIPRRERRDSVASILARFSKNLSFQMSGYQDLSFNASYVLAILKQWQIHERAVTKSKPEELRTLS